MTSEGEGLGTTIKIELPMKKLKVDDSSNLTTIATVSKTKLPVIVTLPVPSINNSPDQKEDYKRKKFLLLPLSNSDSDIDLTSLGFETLEASIFTEIPSFIDSHSTNNNLLVSDTNVIKNWDYRRNRSSEGESSETSAKLKKKIRIDDGQMINSLSSENLPYSVLSSSTDTCDIPTADTSDATFKKINHQTISSSQIQSPRQRHLLIVDDQSSIVNLVVRVLTIKGWICHKASNGAQAIEKVMETSKKVRFGNGTCTAFLYDGILMDFSMPVMDGPTATAEIRRLGYTSLIIGITGNIQKAEVAHFKNAGVSYVLAKPAKLNKVHELLLDEVVYLDDAEYMLVNDSEKEEGGLFREIFYSNK